MPLNTAGLDAFLAGLGAAIDAGVQETAEAIEQKAVGIVPVDTGALRTSIQVNGAGGSGERTIEAGQGLDYAVAVEYGTAKRPATPYLTPAATQTDAAAIVGKHIQELASKSRI